MQYVICYDVADDHRRARLALALQDFGKRIQESVFVANLDAELAGRMRERAGRWVDERTDRLHVFALCEACVGRTEQVGGGPAAGDAEFYIL